MRRRIRARKQLAKEASKNGLRRKIFQENTMDVVKPKVNVRQRTQERERELDACRCLEPRTRDFLRLEFLAQTYYEMKSSSMAPIV